VKERILEDWITTFLAYTEETEPPDLFKVWTAVSAICSCLQRKCWTQWEKQIYPNMYIILVGPPGIRKGTILGYSYDLLSKIGVKMCAESITREALVREFCNAAVNTDSYTDGEATAIHSSMTVFSSELTVFLGQNNLQLISDLNDWYDCKDTWEYRTKHQGNDIIDGVWLNLIGATTPTFLQSALPNDAVGGGLISRIVFIFGDKKSKLVPLPTITEREIKLREQLFCDLEAIYMLKGQFKLTEEYKAAYSDWYLAGEANPVFTDNNLKSYNERRATHLRKLSMVFSASRSNDLIIDLSDFIRARNLLEDTEKFMPFVFAGRGRAALSEILEDIIRELSMKKKLTVQHIMEKHYKDITNDDLDKIIRTLKAARIARVLRSGSSTILEFISKDERARLEAEDQPSEV